MLSKYLPEVKIDPKEATVSQFDIKGGQGNDKLSVFCVRPVVANAQSPLPVVNFIPSLHSDDASADHYDR